MSTSALNAMQNIHQVTVRSEKPTSATMSENPDRSILIQVLGSQPVMPVKADRFENLLAGYSPALKTLLVDGFRNGFQISPLRVTRTRGQSSAVKPPLITQNLRSNHLKLKKSY